MTRPERSIAGRLRRENAAQVSRLMAQAGSGLLPAVAALLFYAASAALSGFLSWRLIAWSPGWGWALYPLVLFFIGTRMRAAGNMVHEACHGILVRGKRRNRLFGHVLAILDFTELDAYTQEHFTHHLYLGDAQRDLDFKPRRRFGFGQPTRHFFLRHYLRPLSLFHVPTFLRPVFFSRRDPLPVAAGRMVYVLALAGVAYGVGLQAFALYYLAPYLTAYQVIRYWSDAVDHAGIIGSADEFHRARNHILSPRWLNRIVFPRNDEYHLAHHLFPAVPVSIQPRVHDLLMKDPVYARRDWRFGSIHRAVREPTPEGDA